MMVKAMMPSTSSMIAAPTKWRCPERVFSLPSSFSVSTEMLTEVGGEDNGRMNMFCRNTGVVASDSMTPGLV